MKLSINTSRIYCVASVLYVCNNMLPVTDPVESNYVNGKGNGSFW